MPNAAEVGSNHGGRFERLVQLMHGVCSRVRCVEMIVSFLQGMVLGGG